MRWSEAVLETRHTAPGLMAEVVSLMWKFAAESGNDALLSNLQCNALDPLGVAYAMESAGVPTPLDLASFLEDRLPPSMVGPFTRAIPLG